MKKFIAVLVIGLVLLIGLALLVSLLLAFTVGASLTAKGIAVIPLKGPIVADETSFSPGMSAFEVVDSLDRAANDPRVKAILLEINSSGGSVVATRQIVEKVKEVRQRKKIVAWISEMGTSGAYYVASASDYIVADPDSITGSIGVLGIFPNIKGLLDKLGIKVKVLKEGRHKDIASIFSDLNGEEERIIQTILHNAFNRFKKDILSFRGNKIDLKKFKGVADGRILSGEQALGIGLIDELGTREKAVEVTASLAGIREPQLINFGKQRFNLFELLSSSGYSLGLGFKEGLLQSKTSVTSLKS